MWNPKEQFLLTMFSPLNIGYIFLFLSFFLSHALDIEDGNSK